ncbi:MAG TPA: 2-amino-4-hydroxy-6-hydroxymethyldihydropteridine diphosphokinase [Kofleriaceae bacterium]|nr:2-amino-4-hydroxy-6-hydroxymethyldihydropteridine diphosphokinase [Kofleriaceae bacterium]
MIALPADAIAIGFGGNVGEDDAIVERFDHARGALQHLGAVRSAGLYRTAPIGPAQPPFLNTAVTVRVSEATPSELLALLRELERLLGRDRSREVRWGPRLIDLDLLLWGTRTLRTPELELPHPRLAERKFVILPLIDLFGDELVVAGQSLAALRERVRDQVADEIRTSW